MILAVTIHTRIPDIQMTGSTGMYLVIISINYILNYIIKHIFFLAMALDVQEKSRELEIMEFVVPV